MELHDMTLKSYYTKARLSTNGLRYTMKQIITGLKYMHDKGTLCEVRGLPKTTDVRVF